MFTSHEAAVSGIRALLDPAPTHSEYSQLSQIRSPAARPYTATPDAGWCATSKRPYRRPCYVRVGLLGGIWPADGRGINVISLDVGTGRYRVGRTMHRHLSMDRRYHAMVR
jgi:hypothetical protein